MERQVPESVVIKMAMSVVKEYLISRSEWSVLKKYQVKKFVKVTKVEEEKQGPLGTKELLS